MGHTAKREGQPYDTDDDTFVSAPAEGILESFIASECPQEFLS